MTRAAKEELMERVVQGISDRLRRTPLDVPPRGQGRKHSHIGPLIIWGMADSDDPTTPSESTSWKGSGKRQHDQR